MTGTPLAPEVLEAVIGKAQAAGCEVERLPFIRDRVGGHYRRLRIDGKLCVVHQLANKHSSVDCKQSYARGTLVRSTLEGTDSQIFYVIDPSGEVSVLVVPSRALLGAFFADGRLTHVIYINHAGTGGKVFNFWLYKDAWKLQLGEEQTKLATAVRRVIPDRFQTSTETVETVHLGAT